MRRRYGDRDGDLSNAQLAYPMNGRRSGHRPPIANLGNDLCNLVDHLLAVRLVLEMGHPGSPRRVVADRPHEEHHGARVGCCDGRNDLRRIHWIK